MQKAHLQSSSILQSLVILGPVALHSCWWTVKTRLLARSWGSWAQSSPNITRLGKCGVILPDGGNWCSPHLLHSPCDATNSYGNKRLGTVSFLLCGGESAPLSGSTPGFCNGFWDILCGTLCLWDLGRALLQSHKLRVWSGIQLTPSCSWMLWRWAGNFCSRMLVYHY